MISQNRILHFILFLSFLNSHILTVYLIFSFHISRIWRVLHDSKALHFLSCFIYLWWSSVFLNVNIWRGNIGNCRVFICVLGFYASFHHFCLLLHVLGLPSHSLRIILLSYHLAVKLYFSYKRISQAFNFLM